MIISYNLLYFLLLFLFLLFTFCFLSNSHNISFHQFSLLDFYTFDRESKRAPCITSLFSLTHFPRRFAFSFLAFHTGISPPSAKFKIRVLWEWSLDALRSQVSWAEVALRLWSMLGIKTISKT